MSTNLKDTFKTQLEDLDKQRNELVAVEDRLNAQTQAEWKKAQPLLWNYQRAKANLLITALVQAGVTLSLNAGEMVNGSTDQPAYLQPFLTPATSEDAVKIVDVLTELDFLKEGTPDGFSMPLDFDNEVSLVLKAFGDPLQLRVTFMTTSTFLALKKFVTKNKFNLSLEAFNSHIVAVEQEAANLNSIKEMFV